jgi:NAD kinase
VLIETAESNDRAKRLAEQFAPFEDRRDPDFILAVGGDGTMLHAIQEHWRKRLPFVGVNAGTRGYLMNGADLISDPLVFLSHLNVVLQPMLYAEFETPEGRVVKANAFNDVWLERLGGQSSWLQVEVGGVVRMSRLVADGVLLATPAGSTAYARSLGATPLLVDAGAFLIVGNNVSAPNWRSAVLSPDVTVRVTNLDPEKRPVRGYADGREIGPVVALTVRLSQAAAAELAFAPERDMARKLMDDQFPDRTA